MSPYKKAKTQYSYSIWTLRWYLCLFLISTNCSDETHSTQVLLLGGKRASSPFFSSLLYHSARDMGTSCLPAPRFPWPFFPWLWLPHHPRALHCYDEWAAACWWELNVSKLPAAFTSAELDGKPNLQARAKQLNSKLPTAATANEPLTWHEPSRWRWHSTSLPAPSCQALGKGRAA